ncbi:protein THEMIS isoform X2 [Phyllostomus discolor]|uniref:Protein THEMIS isoform X2 n=1 Tax=Phyllostomus discolor TaxID=89673 RepID=A0A7E6DNS0_9CHIR|nr:protein THEMIS isoform X2 [Phyllostomus discolor]
MALSLEEFVHSLDLRTLPRVLEVQSGIYFQGSIYEMFGNECCLATGEVIKITGLKIKKIIAEICEHIEGRESPQPFELPMNFPGLFKIVADKTPYLTMEEITRTIHIGPSRLGHPCFYHQKDMKLENLSIKQVQKDIIRILPSLDVEVKDITDSYDANWFLQLLSTQDLSERTSKEFPIVAEVIEPPQGNHLPRSILQPGKTIVIHKKYQASRILASEIRSNFPKRHFLIPTSYKGKFKRRPRELPTAYDLEIAKSEKEALHVVATKAFHPLHDELSSVSVGDQFLVHHSQTTEVLSEGTKKVVNVLACEKILKNSYEAALLPLYMEGGFVEVIHDKKQYQISQLCAQFHWPFNVKVSVRDLFIEEDILAATPGLQLEETITDTYLLISDFANPTECWEIPVSRLNMTVQLVNNNLSQDTGSIVVKALTEEITEEQYYMMRRYESSFSHPPPRPPKHPSVGEAKLTLLNVAEEKTVGLPKSPKSLHVDISKKLHSNQVGLDSKVPAGCQNSLADLEKQRSKSGALQQQALM